MKIGIFSSKGGVGKTSLSFSLALDLDFKYVTNDFSVSLQKYKNSKFMPNKLSMYENCIYDFGGFENSQVYEAIEKLDLILIPTINDANSVYRTLTALLKFKQIPIFIVPNILESKKDLDTIRLVIDHHYMNAKYFPIRKSKLLRTALESGKSATEVYNENDKSKYQFKNAYADYKKILDFIKSFQNDDTSLDQILLMQKRDKKELVESDITNKIIQRGIPLDGVKKAEELVKT